MKTIIIAVILSVVTICNLIAGPADKTIDPIVGHWRWGKTTAIIAIDADGSARGGSLDSGVWKTVPTENVERKYQIIWKGGAAVDKVTLNEAGTRLVIRNNTGQQFTAEKVEN